MPTSGETPILPGGFMTSPAWIQSVLSVWTSPSRPSSFIAITLGYAWTVQEESCNPLESAHYAGGTLKLSYPLYNGIHRTESWWMWSVWSRTHRETIQIYYVWYMITGSPAWTRRVTGSQAWTRRGREYPDLLGGIQYSYEDAVLLPGSRCMRWFRPSELSIVRT